MSNTLCLMFPFNRSFEVHIPIHRNGLFTGVRVGYSTDALYFLKEYCTRLVV